MYTPYSFQERDRDKVLDFIEAYNFGVLFSEHEGEPDATHLPFYLDRENETLVAHFAKANKHWERLNPDKPVLVVFQGPHAYITPHWYEEKQTVPTWNYAAVHIKGKPETIHNEEDLRELVDLLTHHHEAAEDSEWDYESAHSRRDQLLKAIVGIKISITDIQAAFKFNQNRSKADQKGVIEGLMSKDSVDHNEVASIMKRNLGKE